MEKSEIPLHTCGEFSDPIGGKGDKCEAVMLEVMTKAKMMIDSRDQLYICRNYLNSNFPVQSLDFKAGHPE